MAEFQELVASIIFFAGLLVAGWRWSWRRRNPARAEEIGDIDLSGPRRAALIGAIRTQRIVFGLERSLGHAAEIRIGLRSGQGLVKLTCERINSESWAPISIDQAYDEAGGELAILGPPGAGKTTQALILLRALLNRAEGDAGAPVPEMFHLASWAKTRKPLIEWLAGEIRVRHGYPVTMGRSLVFHHNIVPILDGLDEVAPQHRNACVDAINEFWLSHRRGPLVICSRLQSILLLPNPSTSVPRYSWSHRGPGRYSGI